MRPRVLADKLAVACACAGLVAMLLGMWTSRVGTLRPERRLPNGVHAPVIALELLEDRSTFDQIVRPDHDSRVGLQLVRVSERAQIEKAVRIDFAFIPAYTIFFILIGVYAVATLRGPMRLTGIVVAVAILVAALFDIRENTAILGLLYGAVAEAPRAASLVKWRAFFIALGFVAPALFDLDAKPLRRWIGFIAGVMALAGAITGVLAVGRGDDLAIEASAARLTLAFPLSVLFFAARRVLDAGLVTALERLASNRWFGWLADWPSPDKGETVGESVYEPRNTRRQT